MQGFPLQLVFLNQCHLGLFLSNMHIACFYVFICDILLDRTKITLDG